MGSAAPVHPSQRISGGQRVALEQLNSGRWRDVVAVGGTRYRTSTYDTREEARAAGAALVVQHSRAPGKAHTVSEVIEAHLGAANLSPTTMEEYRRIKKCLPSWFAGMAATDVTAWHCDEVYRTAVNPKGKPLTAHRVRRLHELLRTSWKRAVAYRWVQSNVVADATPPALPPRRKLQAPDAKAVSDLMEKCRQVNPTLYVALRLLAHGGMRRGEVAALRWDDILEDGRLRIERSVVEDRHGRLHIRGTKTGISGHRTITIRQDVRDLLDTMERTGEWMFMIEGRPMRPGYLTRAWCRVAKGSGVRLHDLRHRMASEMVSAGVDIRTVSGRLGHASPVTTLAMYSHFSPAKDADAAEGLTF